MIYADSLSAVEYIETGTFIDKLVVGIPRKKLMELFGDSGVGKSTICLQMIAAAQSQDMKCLYADVEWAFDVRYAASMGVDTKKLGVIREQTGEAMLDEIEAEVTKGKWDLVVLDSIGALTPRAELEKGQEGKVIGGQAGMVAKFCRKIIPALAMTNTALVVINHSFVDIMSGAIKTSGGKKLEYHRSVSIRLKTKHGVSLKSGDTKVGKIIIAECKRDKLSGNEGKEIEAQLLFGTGFSKEADLLEEAIRKGIIVKDRASYTMNGIKIAHGQTAMREKLKDESFVESIKALL